MIHDNLILPVSFVGLFSVNQPTSFYFVALFVVSTLQVIRDCISVLSVNTVCKLGLVLDCWFSIILLVCFLSFKFTDFSDDFNDNLIEGFCVLVLLSNCTSLYFKVNL